MDETGNAFLIIINFYCVMMTLTVPIIPTTPQMRTTDGNLANAAAANPSNALESAEAAMDPKQLVANVRKYWDQDDSVESHSKAVPPSSSGNKRAGRRRPSTTGATGPRRRKKEVLVKDWKYWRKNAYRGGGAIWTDPSVHCPPRLSVSSARL